MTWLAAAVALGLFVWSLKRSRAVESAGEAVSTARASVATLLDPALPDADKERAARASSVRMFGHAAAVTLRLAIALAVPLGFLTVLVIARLLSEASLIATLESWPMIVVSTLAVGAALLWNR